MDLELHLSEGTVDQNVTGFLKARIKLRPGNWVNDFPEKGTRTLKATIQGVEEIEQRRIKLYPGRVFRDLDTGAMFSVENENKQDKLLLLNTEKA